MSDTAAMAETPELEAARILAQDPSVRRVILFGSRARGDARARSDIDLAIDAPEADAAVMARLEFSLEERDSLLRVDLVRLQDAPDALAERVRRDGKLLYERAS